MYKRSIEIYDVHLIFLLTVNIIIALIIAIFASLRIHHQSEKIEWLLYEVFIIVIFTIIFPIWKIINLYYKNVKVNYYRILIFNLLFFIFFIAVLIYKTILPLKFILFLFQIFFSFIIIYNIKSVN